MNNAYQETGKIGLLPGNKCMSRGDSDKKTNNNGSTFILKKVILVSRSTVDFGSYHDAFHCWQKVFLVNPKQEMGKSPALNSKFGNKLAFCGKRKKVSKS